VALGFRPECVLLLSSASVRVLGACPRLFNTRLSCEDVTNFQIGKIARSCCEIDARAERLPTGEDGQGRTVDNIFDSLRIAWRCGAPRLSVANSPVVAGVVGNSVGIAADTRSKTQATPNS
jgi:hypothetical protein